MEEDLKEPEPYAEEMSLNVVGWISIPETPRSYLMQGENNEYCLNHT